MDWYRVVLQVNCKRWGGSANTTTLIWMAYTEVINMWGVIAIIILVLLLFGSLLEQNDLKHQLEVKEYEVKRLKDKLENGG